MVISHAKLGLLGSLPRWRAHLACHLSKNDKNVGGLLFVMQMCRGTHKCGKRRSAIRKDGKKLKIP